jgi:hypothetical protein
VLPGGCGVAWLLASEKVKGSGREAGDRPQGEVTGHRVGLLWGLPSGTWGAATTHHQGRGGRLNNHPAFKRRASW